jgi:uncharacterized protein YbbC (DUF1343 family)
MMRPLLPVPPTTGPATAIYVLIALLAVSCQADGKDPASVRAGAEVLAANDFAELEGTRVGLIVNHTARVDTAHLIDRVDRASNVELGALFGPEHGLRGTAGAGEAVTDGRDGRTGAPVYSLYDDTRRPTPSELEGIDALVFDVQDVGARFYTYITTMGLAMQAAAEADLRFVVLDRPNPLGGHLRLRIRAGAGAAVVRRALPHSRCPRAHRRRAGPVHQGRTTAPRASGARPHSRIHGRLVP